MGAWVDRWVGGRVGGWTGGWVDGWVGGWTGGWWTGGWVGGCFRCVLQLVCQGLIQQQRGTAPQTSLTGRSMSGWVKDAAHASGRGGRWVQQRFVEAPRAAMIERTHLLRCGGTAAAAQLHPRQGWQHGGGRQQGAARHERRRLPAAATAGCLLGRRGVLLLGLGAAHRHAAPCSAGRGWRRPGATCVSCRDHVGNALRSQPQLVVAGQCVGGRQSIKRHDAAIGDPSTQRAAQAGIFASHTGSPRGSLHAAKHGLSGTCTAQEQGNRSPAFRNSGLARHPSFRQAAKIASFYRRAPLPAPRQPAAMEGGL